MSEHEQHGKQNPPYIDESLLINSRLSEIERKQSEEAAERRKHERSQRQSNWTVAIFTALLFITSTVSDVLLIRQTDIARDSANAAQSAADTARQTLVDSQKARIAADISHTKEIKESDQHAVDAIKTTSDASRTDQRAWISVGSFTNGSVVLSVGAPFLSNLYMLNTGRTPARNLTVRYSASILKTGEFPAFKDLPKTENSGVVGPGSSAALGSAQGSKNARNITQPEFDALRSHDFTLFAFGRITYYDAFGFYHWTTYCYLLDPDSRTMAQCKSDNDMDNELR